MPLILLTKRKLKAGATTRATMETTVGFRGAAGMIKVFAALGAMTAKIRPGEPERDPQ
jgi:hypothetical protein